MCNMVKYTVIKNMVYIYNSLHNHLHKQRQLQRTDVESRADTKPGLGVTCVCVEVQASVGIHFCSLHLKSKLM